MKKDPRKEVLALWKLRSKAEKKAREGGNKDLGLRAGVTSGRHLDPLSELVRSIFIDAGMPPESVHCGGRNLEIPGYYRPQKKWDVVVVHKGVLVAAVEFKSILGSYGNNMNNRTEESLGNATDLLEAAEQGLIGTRPPWLGFVFFIGRRQVARRRQEPPAAALSRGRGLCGCHLPAARFHLVAPPAHEAPLQRRVVRRGEPQARGERRARTRCGPGSHLKTAFGCEPAGFRVQPRRETRA